MRRKEKEVTDPAWLEEVLEKAEIIRIAFLGEEYPYIVPVNFGYKNRAVYFHSACEGKKLQLIKKFPKVCIEAEIDVRIEETDVPCNWSTRYRSVIAEGIAVIVEDEKEKIRALDTIVSHYKKDFTGDYDYKGVDRLCIVRVDIENMTGKLSD